MKFSLEWLNEYVDVPPIGREIPGVFSPGERVGVEDLARRLTSAGLAVEEWGEMEDVHGDLGGPGILLDIDVTTNRPDVMNHFGLAREISVLLDRPLRRPLAEPAEAEERATDVARVVIEDADGCPRYAARVIRGVKVGPSPDWLRRRLQAIGLRSINNVVDVTNYVLWEMGQPLHAFDLAKLAQAAIVVRRARAGERLVTLDGVERELDPEMLVIADAERAVALAGVMGGADSEVMDATTDILLESAHFGRRRVRQAARRLGIHTDASHRFERGADPEICAEAASRAAYLIAEVAGGQVLSGVIDVRAAEVPVRRGHLDLDRLDAFAGTAMPAADAERWLTGLGFRLEPAGERVWQVTVPSWRTYDFEPRSSGEIYPADLYEEVLRVFGLDNIPAALPGIPGPDAPRPENQVRRTRARRYLAAAGFAEAVHFAFHDPAADAAYPSLRPEAKPLPLANPLSERYSVLRRSLVPNLVESARFNQRRGLAAVRLFEVATVFYDRNGVAGLPDQPEHVALVCGGRPGNPWEGQVELDLFDLKGVVDGLADSLGVTLEARPAELPGLLPGNTAEFLRDGQVVGFLGRVAAEESYPLYVAEVAMEALAGQVGREVELPSRFPGIEADFTLTHALATSWTEIREAVGAARPAELQRFGLEARYQGQGVPEGAVNTTIWFFYNARDRSLTQEEVNARQADLTGMLVERFGWKE